MSNSYERLTSFQRFVCCPKIISKDSISNAVLDNAQIMHRLNVIAGHRNMNLINNNCGLGLISRVHLLGGGGTEALIGKYPWMWVNAWNIIFLVDTNFLLKGRCSSIEKPSMIRTSSNVEVRVIVIMCIWKWIEFFFSLRFAYLELLRTDGSSLHLKKFVRENNYQSYISTLIANFSLHRIAVRLGEHRISTLRDCLDDDCSDPVQDIPIQASIKHDQFNKLSRVNDIAILRLKNEAVLGSSVQTICLPTALNNQIDAIERSSRENMIMTGDLNDSLNLWNLFHNFWYQAGVEQRLENPPMYSSKLCFLMLLTAFAIKLMDRTESISRKVIFALEEETQQTRVKAILEVHFNLMVYSKGAFEWYSTASSQVS